MTGGTWTASILYSFLGGADGCSPTDQLTVAPDGALYGVTLTGGASNLGTVYQLTPPAVAGGAWSESVIHAFTGNPDGSSPNSGVVVNEAKRTLDGAAAKGGTAACDCGVVYSLTPPATAGGAWTEAILHSFSDGPGDGNSPAGPLLADKNGTLYGVTIGGGASITNGTVFSVTP